MNISRKLLVSAFFAVLIGTAATAQGQVATPQIVLSVPRQPVQNTPVTVDVLVENQANAAPAATGNVTLNFGDGSAPVVSALSNSLVTPEHTYTASGSHTVTASYGGDSNFAPATAVQPITILAAAPPAITLNTFGDSITAGTGNSKPSTAFVSVITSTEGWGLDDYAHGGDTVVDQCSVIYGVPTIAGAYNTLLIGQNEVSLVGYPANGGVPEYEGALTACSAWLLLIQDTSHGGSTKVLAQDPLVTRTGAWTNSTLFSSIGLMTTTAGSSLSAQLSGNQLFLNLTSTLNTDYTVAVTIDGKAAGTFSPVLTFNGQTATYAPFGTVLSASGIGPHTVQVTCTVPGSSGCYVDWLGGNATPVAARPKLWLGTPYLTNQGIPAFVYDNLAGDIDQVETQLADAGLSIQLADVHSYFSGTTDPQCMFDKVHPSDCGHAILAATFLGAMDSPSGTATALTASPNPAIAGQNVTLTATVPRFSGSSVPTGDVSFYHGAQLLVSAKLAASVLNSTATASYTASTAGLPAGDYAITAKYAGDGLDRASASAPLTVTLQPKIVTGTTLTATPNPASVGQTVTLTAAVARKSGTGFATGTVTFYYQGTAIGKGTVNASGVATLAASSAGLAKGTYSITATYSGDAEDDASSSPALAVTLQ
jgi:hypothetical protein